VDAKNTLFKLVLRFSTVTTLLGRVPGSAQIRAHQSGDRSSLKSRTHLLYSWVPLGSGMRAKFIFATLVGLLFCSLATLEITEFFELTDDTSNDFSLVGTQQASSAVVPQSLELQPKTNPTTETERPTARRLPPSASYHARDVLHLLCIMRT
jgi:hypothetical protein